MAPKIKVTVDLDELKDFLADIAEEVRLGRDVGTKTHGLLLDDVTHGQGWCASVTSQLSQLGDMTGAQAAREERLEAEMNLWREALAEEQGNLGKRLESIQESLGIILAAIKPPPRQG